MKSGRQRREEIKGQRNSETQSATRRKQSRARRRVPWETCRWTSRLSRRTTLRRACVCSARLLLLFVVMAVAKRRSGQRRNKSGGMKSLRVTFTRTQSFAGRAARGNGPDARKRGVFILKASDAKDRRSSNDSR